jgi:hypothetical protein
MAKERRVTLQPVSGQPANNGASEPVAAAPKPKGRSGTALYVRLPRDLKVEVDVVAATLQVPQNVLVTALLQEYVSRDRVGELTELVARYTPPPEDA